MSRKIARKEPGNEARCIQQYEHLDKVHVPRPFLRQILTFLELACVKICCERDESRLEPGSTKKAMSLPTKSAKST